MTLVNVRKRQWQKWGYRLRLVILLVFVSITTSVKITVAQLTPDNTLGNENSLVTPKQQIRGALADLIQGGAIREHNLFHSFSEFNVNELQRVYFANPTGIKNILTRVTGNNISNIFGTLGVLGEANLWLINPNGIYFGKNAKLNIRGSFIATTAEAIQFGEQGIFSVSQPNVPPLLTVNPSALFFNQIKTASIINRSTASAGVNSEGNKLFGLQVPNGQSLLLIGSEVLLDGGGISASDGRVELAAIGNRQTIDINVNNNDISLSLAEPWLAGNVSLINRAQIDVSGVAGGSIQIWGNQITLADRSSIIADTFGEENGQGITLQAGKLIIQDGSQISASAIENSRGNSGGITVNAHESVELIGAAKEGQTNNPNSGSGQGNNLNQNQGKNPGQGQGQGQGNNNGAGQPSKLASDARGDGIAGDLIINTGHLILQDGAKISSSTIQSSGGGNIIINANNIELIGINIERQRASSVSVQTRGDGKAGNITLNTQNLIIQNGAEITASTFGKGDGGDINIYADQSVQLIGFSEDGQLFSRLIAETGGSLSTQDVGTVIGLGKGGNITLNTAELLVQDGAQISVSNLNTEANNAGTLKIIANLIQLDQQGKILSITNSGDGGDINLEVQNLLILNNQSQISTSAGLEGQGGNGGNITISSPWIIAFPNQDNNITANAFEGIGGNINITTNALFGIKFTEENLPLRNDITASSEFGLDGTVTINTPDIDPTSGLISLPTNLVDSERLIAQNACKSTANQGNNRSAFIVTGRGGLPVSPYETLNTNATWEDWRLSENNAQENREATVTIKKQETIIQAQGWVITPKGEIILTAQPLMVTPQGTSIPMLNCQ